jgi:hypothetical protein
VAVLITVLLGLGALVLLFLLFSVRATTAVY